MKQESLHLDLDEVISNDTASLTKDSSGEESLSPTTGSSEFIHLKDNDSKNTDGDEGSIVEELPGVVFHTGVPGVTGHDGHDSFGNIAVRFGFEAPRTPGAFVGRKRVVDTSAISVLLEEDDAGSSPSENQKADHDSGDEDSIVPNLPHLQAPPTPGGPLAWQHDSMATVYGPQRQRPLQKKSGRNLGKDEQESRRSAPQGAPDVCNSDDDAGDNAEVPRRRSKSITFDKGVVVSLVESAKDLVDQPSSLWFQADEYDQIRQDAYDVIDAASRRASSSECNDSNNGSGDEEDICPRKAAEALKGDEDKCIRGLEALLEADKICEIKYMSWDCVLEEQELQIQEGFIDEDYLADVYRVQSEESMQDALLRAQQDEEEAQEYQTSTRNLLERLVI